MLAITATPCLAEDYYLEIGKDVNQADAAKEWESLATKYKNQLGKLHFYPKAIIQEGTTIATRLQAGPITNKAKAQKVCNKLFTDHIPCFVIEGSGSAPPASMINMSEKKVALPWLAGSSQQATLPWLGEGKSKQGKVEVAEAIRVPLSDNTLMPKDARVDVKALPAMNPTFKNGNATSKNGDDGGGWLTVSEFPDQDIASAFWDEVRAASPKLSSGLHARVMKPLLSHNESKTSLNIGPFRNGDAAYAFCNEGIQAKERGLTCSFIGQEPNAGESQYASQERHRPLENPPSYAPVAGPSRQYWVQVVSAPSQIEALRQWEDIRSNNRDILGGMRSNVSLSGNDKTTYAVRVGPIANNDDAIKLCAAMQARNIDCRVLLYSASR